MVNKPLKHLGYLLYLLWFTAPGALGAPNTWYEVEILVFKHLTQESEVSETGRADSTSLNLARTPGSPPGGTNTPTKEATDLLPLSPQAWKLTGIEQRLNKSPHYRSLLHQAWKQPVTSQGHAQPFHLHLSTKAASNRGAKTASENRTGATSRDEAPFSSKPLGPRLEGHVKLSQGRSLHLALDLIYRQLREATSPLRGHFRLTESRRIRVQELHYFDHPRFGVLAQVRQSANPKTGHANTPKTFPLESSATREIPPKKTSETIKSKE